MDPAETGCDPERLARLLADALVEAEKARAIGHLDNCEPCRRALESLAADGCVVHGTLRSDADVGFTTCRRGHRIVVRRVARALARVY